jgi:hypothetical protein
MTTYQWLIQFIFIHTRLSIPDGRPLYAYKCTERKYLQLKSMMPRLLSEDLINQSARYVPAIFCLYAAETFSREHTGGIWTWETVFHPLGMMIPERNVIEHWVKNGLNWWGRELLLGQNKHRHFLVSIACEGGLPLRLLENDSAALNHFFRYILENYHAMGCGGLVVAQQVAFLNAYRLPSGLRQDVVFRLSGELIASVVELQTKYEIGRVQNPIAVLDEKDSNWRKKLPLRVEDGVAETLFNGLLKRSDQLTRTANAKLRWVGKLYQIGTEYKIEKILQLPEIVNGELVQQWLGQDIEAPPRLQFVLKTHLGSQTIARLTLCAGSGETARYLREWLRKDGVRLVNEEVCALHSLFLHDGQKEYPLDVKAGYFWNEALPWIFTEKGATNEFEFFGEGSVRIREEQVFILAKKALKPHAFGTGSFEELAYIQELNRTVWRVVGHVDFITEELDRYRIACKSEDDLSEICQIVGDILTEVNNSQPVYRGLPNIRIGNSINRNCYRTQWRAVNGGKGWQDCNFDDLAFGHVWLRLQNKEDETEIYRRKILVVPNSFKIETVIGGVDSINGIYRLKGFKGAVISTDVQSEISIVSDDNIEINCPRLETTNLPDISIAFHWTTANLQIKLPYPQRGAIFQMAGQTLHYGDCVHVDRLGGLRLFLQDSVGGQSYWIDAELIAEDRQNADLPRLRFSTKLPILARGRVEISLISWQERIISLLNSSRKLDAYVSVKITSSQGDCLAIIQIARFDCVVQSNFSGYQVYLPCETITRLGDDWQQRVTVEMFPLWSPKDKSLLESNSEQLACWNVPDNLESGTWWIVAKDGNWARFRPLLWGVKNEIPNHGHDSELVMAIREDNNQQREILLHDVLKALGENFLHPDWTLMFNIILLSREFPTSSLDVLTHLVSHPQTLALALLKADDESFQCVWLLAEQIPFAWGLLSVHCWEKATRLYFKSLHEAIGDIDLPLGFYFDIFQKFRERTASSGREYWQSLCDWLQERIFEGHELGNSPLLLARRSPKVFEGQIIIAEQELQARHSATEEWVKSIEIIYRVKKGFIDEKYQYQHIFNDDLRAVRCAPFVAASLSIKGIPLDKKLLSELKAKDDDLEWISLRQLYPYIITDNLIYELRLIRSFDPEWFDRTYAIALTLELASLPVELT